MGSKIIKQVIVMRKDLNMRKGKMIAQGSHASMAFLTRKAGVINGAFTNKYIVNLDEVMQWCEEGFTKICVSVNTDEELITLYKTAHAAGLNVELITDAGHTEFAGIPTRTCLAIGPNKVEEIDKITKHLPLL